MLPTTVDDCPVGWGCRIHRLHFTNEYPGYEIKQSGGEVPIMLDLWRMQSTPSLPSLPGLLLSGVMAPDGALSMGQIKLNCII